MILISDALNAAADTSRLSRPQDFMLLRVETQNYLQSRPLKTFPQAPEGLISPSGASPDQYFIITAGTKFRALVRTNLAQNARQQQALKIKLK